MILFAAALAWEPTPAETTLVAELSQRHSTQTCPELVQNLTDPVASLSAVVEHVEYPPWAAMRAASCLVSDHEEAAEALFIEWVTTPSKKGLAKLVLRRTDQLSTTRAARIERAALSGPLAEEARKIIGK